MPTFIHRMVLFTLFLFAQNQGFTADLALKLHVSRELAAKGDTISCTLELLNEGKSEVGNIAIQMNLASGLRIVSSFLIENGKFDQGTGIWTIERLPAGRLVTRISGRVRVEAEGPLMISAEILRMSEPDMDSSPGNHVLQEDDISYTCISVPIVYCGAEKIRLTAEAYPGFGGYQWHYEGQPIPGETGLKILITQPGRYHCTAPNTSFSFPIIVRQMQNFSLDLGPPISICSGEKHRLSARPTGGQAPYTYQWKSDKGDWRQRLKVGDSATYTVRVRDNNGCVVEDSVQVKVNPCY